ncbi:MAG: histidinol-phosphate transaminase [Candidatus Bathyarchaeia archaeon]|nr:histidinol-phosphate transaminase [Candidatus Bathyarchaeota archaeon]
MTSKKIIEEIISRGLSLDIYDVGETIEGLASKLGKRPDEILKLNSNENFFVPLELLRDVLRQVIEECDPRIYPRDEYRFLRRSISNFIGVPEECVVIGAGSDQLIELISRIFLRDGDDALSIEPTFSIYERCIRVQGATYKGILLKDDFSLDVESMLSAVTPRTRIIFLCSPNNPTANNLKREDILGLAEKFEGPVAIDETYADFAGTTLSDAAQDFSNLIIFRTFSKTFGLAGLRVGYAIANKRLARIIEERFQMPYSVSMIALRAAAKMLELWDEVAEAINAIRRERANLIEALKNIRGVRVFPSETNFVLFQVDRDSTSVYKSLMERGIIIRNIGRVLKFDNCLRVTVAPSHMMERFIRDLREIMHGAQ